MPAPATRDNLNYPILSGEDGPDRYVVAEPSRFTEGQLIHETTVL